MPAVKTSAGMLSSKIEPLNSSQAQILSVLAKYRGTGMTVAQIKDKVGEGVAVNSGNLGPVFENVLANYPDSLVGRGLVNVIALEGRERLFSANDRGRKMAEKVKFRKRIPAENVVPDEELDEAVKKVRPSKTYGLEHFTDEDIKEVRSLLSQDFHSVPPDHLRQQICNRRKKGAYADPLSRTKKAVEGAVRNFGPEGELIKGLLTSNQLQKMRTLLAGSDD